MDNQTTENTEENLDKLPPEVQQMIMNLKTGNASLPLQNGQMPHDKLPAEKKLMAQALIKAGYIDEVKNNPEYQGIGIRFKQPHWKETQSPEQKEALLAKAQEKRLKRDQNE